MTKTALEIQKRLVELGYNPGTVDGKDGPNTKNAVMLFQVDNHLDADGIVGPKTEAAMFPKEEAKPKPPSPKGMTVSPNGRKKISGWEGNVLTAYQDSVGVWTIGVGHTASAGPPAPKKGMVITAKQSDEILSDDLKEFEAYVNKAITVLMTQNQFDALTSLVFNIGPGNFNKSTLVKKMNAGDTQGAADQFLVWNKAGGKVVKGLTTRRKAERELFLTK